MMKIEYVRADVILMSVLLLAKNNVIVLALKLTSSSKTNLSVLKNVLFFPLQACKKIFVQMIVLQLENF